MDEWRKVLFTDKSHFCVHGQHDRYVRRSADEQLSSQHVNQHVKHPEKVMIWGCFSAVGPGHLQLCEGTLKTAQYIEIINSRIIPDLWEKFPDGDGVLQQDKAPCHTSKKSLEHLQRNLVTIVDWLGNWRPLRPSGQS